MDVKCKPIVSKDRFCSMSSPASRMYKLVITFPSLFVKKMQVALDLENNCCLRKQRLFFYIIGSHMKEHFMMVFCKAFAYGLCFAFSTL